MDTKNVENVDNFVHNLIYAVFGEGKMWKKRSLVRMEGSSRLVTEDGSGEDYLCIFLLRTD